MIYRNYIKRLLDIILSFLLLLPILIVILIFGVLIKYEDEGPIFYCANRLGYKRTPFRMIKLRSMKVNAPDLRNIDGTTYNSENDDRLLKIGKFIRKTSIDELPQIFNVIAGDMSFIGPRPDLESQSVLYDELQMDKTKFKVKPGITGYAQCNGRNAINWDDKLKLDSFYVKHCSLRLDVIIFFKTIGNVLMRRGVNKYD